MEQKRGASSKASRSALDRDLTEGILPVDASKLLARGGITLLVLLFVFALFSHIPPPGDVSPTQSGKLSQNFAGEQSPTLEAQPTGSSRNLVGFAGEPPATLSVAPVTQNVDVGSTFTITLPIAAATNVYGYQFNLKYNPALIQFMGGVKGGFLSTGYNTMFDSSPLPPPASPGTVLTYETRIGIQPGQSGSGNLAVLTFQALAPGTSSITLDGVILSDPQSNPLPSVVQSGQVVVSVPFCDREDATTCYISTDKPVGFTSVSNIALTKRLVVESTGKLALGPQSHLLVPAGGMDVIGSFLMQDSSSTLCLSGPQACTGRCEYLDSRVVFNGLTNGASGMTVSGEFVARNSVFTNNEAGDCAGGSSTARYYMVNSGKFNLSNTTVRNAGWADANNQRGVELGGTLNLIAGSRLINDYYGTYATKTAQIHNSSYTNFTIAGVTIINTGGAILNNVFLGNTPGSRGIALSGQQILVQDNRIGNVPVGISLSAVSNSNIKNNTIINASLGLNTTGATDITTLIYFNKFVRNQLQARTVMTDAAKFYITELGINKGNFWSDIIDNGLDITDTNSDSYGDAGTQYPYQLSNGANVQGPTVDRGPIVRACLDDFDCYCGALCGSNQCIPVTDGPTCDLPGDSNGNGEVDCVDVNCALTVSAGLPPPPECTRAECMDIAPIGAPDGSITIGDVVVTLRLAVQSGNYCAGSGTSIFSSPIGPSCTEAQCHDGRDNDGDGNVDFGFGPGADPGCDSPADNTEVDQCRQTAVWTPTGLFPDLNGAASITALGTTIYAGTSPTGDVFKSTDSGNLWTNTGDLASATYVYTLLSVGGTLYAGTTPTGDVFKSTDGGNTWVNTGNLAGATTVWSLARVGTTIYAGTSPGGNVFKSTDGGASWSNTGDLTGADIVWSLAAIGTTVYAGTAPNGDVFKSTDGQNWVNTGDLAGATAVGSLTVFDSAIYAGTSPNGDVFKSTNDGSSWTNTGDLPTASSVHGLYYRGGSLYAGTASADPIGDIFQSDDGGNSWYPTSIAPGDVNNVYDFIYDPVTDKLYAATNSAINKFVYRSGASSCEAECSDHYDNDGDGKIDYGTDPDRNDPDCTDPGDTSEDGSLDPTPHTLTTGIGSGGQGVEIWVDGGLLATCTVDPCTQVINAGSLVELRAIPQGGFDFSRWRNAVDTGDATVCSAGPLTTPCTFTMDADKAARARFKAASTGPCECLLDNAGTETGTCTISNEVCESNTNITILSGGYTTLINTTLFMNGTADGKLGIEVRSGGRLNIINTSNLTANNSNFEFAFQVFQGATLGMTDSSLSESGWAQEDGRRGLELWQAPVALRNNLFTNNFNSVVLRAPNILVNNNRFTGLQNATIQIINVTGADIRDNSIYGLMGLTFGIKIFGTANHSRIRNNLIRTTLVGINNAPFTTLKSYNLSIFNNTINTSNAGNSAIAVRISNGTIAGNLLIATGTATSFVAADYTRIENNTLNYSSRLFGSSSQAAIYLMGSYNTIAKNIVQNHVGISIEGGDNNLIHNNAVFYDDFEGIRIKGFGKNNVTQNAIKVLGAGYVDLVTIGAATENRIWQNHFLGKGVDNQVAGNVFCFTNEGNFYNESITPTKMGPQDCGPSNLNDALDGQTISGTYNVQWSRQSVIPGTTLTYELFSLNQDTGLSTMLASVAAPTTNYLWDTTTVVNGPYKLKLVPWIQGSRYNGTVNTTEQFTVQNSASQFTLTTGVGAGGQRVEVWVNGALYASCINDPCAPIDLPVDASVELRPIPLSGFLFDRWRNAGDTNDATDCTAGPLEAPCTFTMDSDKAARARFTAAPIDPCACLLDNNGLENGNCYLENVVCNAGNLTINQTGNTTLVNVTLTVAQFKVNLGGRLVIRNSLDTTIHNDDFICGGTCIWDTSRHIMNGQFNGDVNIYVEPGADMQITRSEITNGDASTGGNPDAQYRFLVKWPATFSLTHSAVRHAGWRWPTLPGGRYDTGLMVYADDAAVVNNTFTDDYMALGAMGDRMLFDENIIIQRGDLHAADSSGASRMSINFANSSGSRVTNNRIFHNDMDYSVSAMAFSVDSPNATVVNNLADNLCGGGIAYITNATNDTITDNHFSVRGVSSSCPGGPGVSIDQQFGRVATNVHIERNTFEIPSWVGIIARGIVGTSNNPTQIKDNLVRMPDSITTDGTQLLLPVGIQSTNVNFMNITNNTVRMNNTGIMLSNTNFVNIADNDLSTNHTGVFMNGAGADLAILRNRIRVGHPAITGTTPGSGQPAGIGLGDLSGGAFSRVTIADNLVETYGRHIPLWSSASGTSNANSILRNTLTAYGLNQNGMNLTGTSPTAGEFLVQDNIIRASKFAISSNAQDSMFMENHFLSFEGIEDMGGTGTTYCDRLGSSIGNFYNESAVFLGFDDCGQSDIDDAIDGALLSGTYLVQWTPQSTIPTTVPSYDLFARNLDTGAWQLLTTTTANSYTWDTTTTSDGHYLLRIVPWITDDQRYNGTNDRSNMFRIQNNPGGLHECEDGSDNADPEDEIADFPWDPGCDWPWDTSEIDQNRVQCRNNRDDPDTEDRLADFPRDPGCFAGFDDDETDFPSDCDAALRITNNPRMETQPVLHTRTLAWSDAVTSSNQDVPYYDTERRNVLSAENSDLAYSYSPDTYGDYVVWHQQDTSPGYPPRGPAHIWLYNHQSGVRYQITDDAYDQFLPRIYEHYVVYQHRNSITVPFEIWQYDIDTGEKQALTSNSDTSNQMPIRHGDYFTYINMHIPAPDSPPQVYLYLQSMITGDVTELTDQLSTTDDLYGHYVVYGATPGGTGNSKIFLYDIRTGDVTQLTDGTQNSYSPRIHGNYVVYHQLVSGTAEDIFRYNILTGVTERVVSTAASERLPDVFDKKITWFSADGDDIFYERMCQLPACADGVDNDEDGYIDWPVDPGCFAAGDEDEFNGAGFPECSNTIDDADPEDAIIDSPWDPGCISGDDPSEVDPATPPQCADDVDNDGDGKIDWPEDPGCINRGDNDETNPDTECADGHDNDDPEDTISDFPNDPGCTSGEDDSEIDLEITPQCADGIDNDGDGFTDWPQDPGCFASSDNDETDTDPTPRCADGLDNDGDGTADYWGVDLNDDGDFTDSGEFAPDCGCQAAGDDQEASDCLANCGNGIIDNGESCDPNASPDPFGGQTCTDFGFDLGTLVCLQCQVGTSQCSYAQCNDGIDNDGDLLVDFPWDLGCDDYADDDEQNGPPTQCSDTLDNDRDKLCDFPLDPQCSNSTDTTEAPQVNCRQVLRDNQMVWVCDLEITPACGNGADDDHDGFIDFTLDPGCYAASDASETNGAGSPACADQQDNDGDGFVDYPFDPGCTSGSDASEVNPVDLPQCGDDRDNDEDGNVDFPFDAGCLSAADDDEFNAPGDCTPQCSDGLDNDGDGYVDFPFDPGCYSPLDNNERDPPTLPECGDHQDNIDIEDALIDFGPDPGCFARGDPSENDSAATPQCANGLDDDSDGEVDMLDCGCQAASDNSEASDCPIPPGCGDGFVDITEECDDGNNNNQDGCSRTCTLENYCGNSVIERPNDYNQSEDCDGTEMDSFSCDMLGILDPSCPGRCNGVTCSSCSAIFDITDAECGDGTLDICEFCDPSAPNGGMQPGLTCADFGHPGCTIGLDVCKDTCTPDLAACEACDPVCGNHILEDPEECDGSLDSWTCTDLGFDEGTLACGATCEFDTSGCVRYCGDGFLDLTRGEECDDGNQATNDGCSATCTLERYCGNNVISFPNDAGQFELCDTNQMDSWTCQNLGVILDPSCVDRCTLSCDATCNPDYTVAGATCNDGILDICELCDPTAPNGGMQDLTCEDLGHPGCNIPLTTCGADCIPDMSPCEVCQPACGNSIVEGTEQCDGNSLDGWTCQTFGFDAGTLSCGAAGSANECQFDTAQCTTCGNAVCESGESITCPQDCSCGNGVLEPLQGEECDDANRINGDGCSSTCTIQNYCGNDMIERPNDAGQVEQCDTNQMDAFTCQNLGGILGQQCEDRCQGTNCDALCLAHYTINGATCGDGTLDACELCEGTQMQTHPDGTPLTCADFGHPTCNTPLTACNAATCTPDISVCGDCPDYCGNNIVEGTEQCDGAALDSLTCRLFGFDAGTLSCGAAGSANACRFSFTQCYDFVCGNGIDEGVEDCDDGNLLANDGCSPTCTLENYCGNDVIERPNDQNFAEQCDTNQMDAFTCANLLRIDPTCTQGCTESCTNQCLAQYIIAGAPPPTCNNGILESCELCDGTQMRNAPGGGPLTCADFGNPSCANIQLTTCTATCTPDLTPCNACQPYCGDHILELGEDCDGAALNSWTCIDFGFSAGTLSCGAPGGANACEFDTSQCSVCGDGRCAAGETNANCAQDCQPTCVDQDGDGFGVGTTCTGPTDCNDANLAIHPGAAEACDSIDNNCDNQVDEGCVVPPTGGGGGGGGGGGHGRRHSECLSTNPDPLNVCPQPVPAARDYNFPGGPTTSTIVIESITQGDRTLFDRRLDLHVENTEVAADGDITLTVSIRNAGFYDLTNVKPIITATGAEVLSVSPDLIPTVASGTWATFTVVVRTGEKPFDLTVLIQSAQDSDDVTLHFTPITGGISVNPLLEFAQFALRFPAWLLLLLALPLLVLLAYTAFGGGAVPMSMLTEDMLKKLEEHKLVQQYEPLYTLPTLKDAYAKKYPKMKAIKPKHGDDTLASRLKSENNLDPDLSALIATASHKPLPVILTDKRVSAAVRQRFKKMKFIDPIRTMIVSAYVNEYYLAEIVRFIEKERLKDFGDGNIRQKLENSGWNAQMIDRGFAKAAEVDKKPMGEMYLYIQRERKRGYSDERIRTQLGKVGWNKTLIEKGFTETEKREREACEDLINYIKRRKAKGQSASQISAELRREGWSDYHITKYLAECGFPAAG